MGELSRRQRARQDKRRRIIEAAAELFRAKGFDATTTDEIAARADIAKGTLFLYAPTKLHLLVLVYEDDLARLVAQAFASVHPEASIVATLVEIFSPFFQLYAQDVELARRFVREQLFVDQGRDQSGAALVELMSGLITLIRSWQDNGRVAAEVDPVLAAQSTFALYFAVLVAWLRGQLSAPQRDERLRATLALLWRGLITAGT